MLGQPKTVNEKRLYLVDLGLGEGLGSSPASLGCHLATFPSRLSCTDLDFYRASVEAKFSVVVALSIIGGHCASLLMPNLTFKILQPRGGETQSVQPT